MMPKEERPKTKRRGPVMGKDVTTDRLFELLLGFMESRTFLAAVELGLFSELAKRPLDGEALRARLGLHPRSARDFFDALVAMGVLERDDGRYSNSAAADRFLDRGKPTYIGGLMEMASARLYRFWSDLPEALKSGKPQNEIKGGEDIFAALYADPAKLRQFPFAMAGQTRNCAEQIARKFPWSNYRTVVDIGTTAGALPVQLALIHPHLRGGGFDLPPVEAIFEEYVGAHGLSDRLKFHPGDFFRDPMPHADVLTMGMILHDWDMEQKRALIRKAYDALPRGGALLVYEFLIDDERRNNLAGLLESLTMLIETQGGFDYTGADCLGWMRQAGFRETQVEHLSGPHWMVVGTK
jgi:O-methyltransferase domain/Dimerisation domain